MSFSSESLAFPDELHRAYQAGTEVGQRLQTKIFLPTTLPHDLVPGFSESSLNDTRHGTTDPKKEAASAVDKNEINHFMQEQYLKKPMPKNDPLINTSTAITKNAKGLVDHSNATAFCMQGDCTTPHFIPSPDFNQAMSALSGTAHAAKDFDGQHIFTGYRTGCRKDVIDFSNCCSDSGWGHDVNLASCHRDEKELGTAKEAGLCHEVGTYCSDDDFFGICLMHRRSYCCFHSKLARIIQEQGREQLKLGWGDPESPDCRGLTPDELQRVDLAKIDFSAFYADLQANEHKLDPVQLQTQMEAHVKRFYGKGTPS